MTGYIDSIRGRVVTGWAVEVPGEVTTVQLLINGREVATTKADLFREDLLLAGVGDGRHGFSFTHQDVGAGLGQVAVQAASGRRLIDNSGDRNQRLGEAFQNSRLQGLPEVDFGFTEAKVSPESLIVASELIEIWRSIEPSTLTSLSEPGSLWDLHFDNCQGEVIDALRSGDHSLIAATFLRLPSLRITDGIYQGQDNHQPLRDSAVERRHEAAIYADGLISFAQYLDLRKVECPEQSALGAALCEELEAVIADVEAYLGFEIAAPHILDGLFGVSRSRINIRDIQALYFAHRALKLCNKSICEIGGGLGRAAYYATKMGCGRYTIIDLPIICLIQYFVLRLSLPDVPVTFEGTGQINIIRSDRISNNNDTFGLVVNCDSFPEMGETIVGEYAAWIAQRSTHLFSLNQEAAAPLGADHKGSRQTIVADVFGKAGWKREQRFRTWVRKGYVDEIWVLEASTSNKPRQIA